jgi:hypothetical protein
MGHLSGVETETPGHFQRVVNQSGRFPAVWFIRVHSGLVLRHGYGLVVNAAVVSTLGILAAVWNSHNLAFSASGWLVKNP